MTKTQKDYLGENSYIDNDFVHLSINDLVALGDSTFWNKPDPTDFNAYVALIISALFNGALAEKDEYGYTVIDKTQGIVSDETASRISLTTREDEKQILHKFVFNVYSHDNTQFTSIDVIGTNTVVNTPVL